MSDKVFYSLIFCCFISAMAWIFLWLVPKYDAAVRRCEERGGVWVSAKNGSFCIDPKALR